MLFSFFRILSFLFLGALLSLGSGKSSTPPRNSGFDSPSPITTPYTTEKNTTTESEDKTTTQEKVTAEKDMEVFSPLNPEEEVYYEKDDKVIRANFPDYSHYNEEDVLIILGEPDEKIENPKKAMELLDTLEKERVKEELRMDKLTVNQAKAFNMQSTDIMVAGNFGANITAFIYKDGKPNVYFIDGKVKYITPLTEYINFKGEKDQE